MVRNRLATALLFAVVYATQAGHGDCSGDILHDSGFDLWCGERLCSWQVDKGEVRQAPTWHQEDLGVELVGDQVAISQRSDVADVSCVRFDLVADIDLDATVVLEMDLYDDGVVDYSQQLPTAAWQDLSYQVRMPAHVQGIRFRLSKTGAGRAVLAQIRARDEAGCEGAPLAQPEAPLGADCWGVEGEELVLLHDLCASGTCAVSDPSEFSSAICSACDGPEDCDGFQVCGLESRVASFLGPYRACVAAASHGLGELCAGDDECQTGVCCGGRCADCCAADDRACPDGSACAAGEGAMPDRCAGDRASGGACLDDADCASGRCRGDGPLQICLADGRRCDRDSDCPPDGTQDGEEFGSCAEIGVSRGICD